MAAKKTAKVVSRRPGTLIGFASLAAALLLLFPIIGLTLLMAM